MTEDAIKTQLVAVTTELYRAGVITAVGGNVSARCATRPDAAWITPSRIFKGALRAEDLVLIDGEGKKLAGDWEPSVEAIYHANLLRLRPAVNAVVHSHAPLATVFGLGDWTMPPITAEAVFIRDFPIIPFFVGGTPELAQAVVEHLGQSPANGAYLRNHGLITLGGSLREAADLTLMVEHTLKILFQCHALGRQPSLIPPESVDQLLREHRPH